jgi:hypothetical protein
VQTTQTLNLQSRATPWLLATASLGAAWNVFGIVQFAKSLVRNRESLMAGGMTAAQAELVAALPFWMTLAFAVGVFGGLAGSVLLGLRRRAARPVLAVSLLAYALLFAGDAMHGVFAALPSQLAILSLVVLIAAALSVIAERSFRQGGLA